MAPPTMHRAGQPPAAKLALEWMEDGGPGFDVAGIPHRVVVDGQFYIGRITVQRHGEPA